MRLPLPWRLGHVGIPAENASPVFLTAVAQLTPWGIAAGLLEC
jgi:hypothetical protein